MSPSRVAIAALAMAVLSVAPSVFSDDNAIPTPPVPGKSLPAQGSKQAARQAELESAHRAAANEWRTTLAEAERQRSKGDAEDTGLIEYIRSGIKQETLGAEYHAKLKQRFLRLGDPRESSISHDPSPPQICRSSDQDRAVLEAFLKHVLDSWRADDRLLVPPRNILLDAYTFFEPDPKWFRGELKESGLTKVAALELEADIGQRNASGCARLAELTFVSPRILVRDLGVANPRRGKYWNEPDLDELEKIYPGLDGYAEAYLPGYSRDGNTAVVRIYKGPPANPHGFPSFTGLLVKSHGEWKVTWESFYLSE